jgi:hypothetical protein
MFGHRDRFSRAPKSQLMRLIGMGAGTTPWCAGEKILFASSTQKRSVVSAHPSRSITQTKKTGAL